MFKEVGNFYHQSVTFTNLGDTYLATGEAEAAARAWRQALNILTALNHPRADQVRAKLSELRASHHELSGPDGAQGSRPRAFTRIGATSSRIDTRSGPARGRNADSCKPNAA